MARVAEWECVDCRARWYGPVGNVNYVVSRVCSKCGEKKMMAWGRIAKEDGKLEVKDEVNV